MVDIDKKTDYNFLHFSERMKERYSIEVTEDDYKNLHTQKPIETFRTNKNKQLCILMFNGKPIIVAKRKRVISTALPFYPTVKKFFRKYNV